VTGDALFELQGVRVDRGGSTILDGIDTTIAGAGVTVLLGPSGAGKSTMLRLFNRLEMATSGVVRFRGNPVDGLDPLQLRRQVGMVFQRPTPFAGTVRDNLTTADPSLADSGCHALLERVGLPARFLDQTADDLSGGEAQRMCLARTLATAPTVLLMDEPTSALDGAASRVLEGLAQELASGGVPVVWVTHDLAQAERVGTDQIVLAAGRIATEHETRHFLDSRAADDHEGEEGGTGGG
jgi:putative ABC transport system ATP-binding protein